MNHVGDINIDDKLRKASAEAAQLKAHLAAATNMKTGALDFTKLNRSLKDSGVSLQHYGETLRAMGPEGQRAFSQLARAVAQSEVPIRRTNKLVKEMSTTLKNSLRWQLSSSILHGFMTSMSDAYNYAKNLNSALTDIRIVSGQSADQMARFAKQANIAAKDLSTTTNEYAKAALIYYQQGLKQQEVTERTEVTVKMANVTGDAAQDVSSYMTAIWNNFNKAGDESVEHYADIMTKLGAATAASTSEIAAGLSKFSAVADTIGLSFEMATSAVTAIVDQTRETPEVVGTALKTIFSRIEGLQQGETMEDGVNLNKYSKGLQKVGVDIMDTNGKLKDADQILKEIGNKWETLDKNQQVALAQTTAGVRQYNQFMALFDNWDKVEQNLTLAATAEGTLDQQAEIYAESWEAASNRVRASLEGLFDSLLEDDFFIGLLNGFSELIGFIEGTVDALGGMKGVLLAIGAILTKVFSSQMAGGLRNMAENIQMMTPKGRQKVIDQKAAFLKNAAESGFDENAGYGDRESQARRNSIQGQVELQNLFLENEKKMNNIERSSAQTLLDNYSAQSERVAEAAKNVDTSKELTHNMRQEIYGEAIREFDGDSNKAFNSVNEASNNAKKRLSNLNEYDKILQDISAHGEVTADDFDKLTKVANEMDPENWNNLSEKIPKIGSSAEKAAYDMDKLKESSVKAVSAQFESETANFIPDKEGRSDAYINAIHQQMKAEEDLTQKQKDEAEKRKQAQDQINNAQGVKATAADGIISIANAAANAMMVVTMLSGAIQTLKSPDASGWDKFLAIISALGVAIPILTSSFTMLSSAESIAGVEALANAAAQTAQAAATKKSAQAMVEDIKATNANSKATGANSQQTTLNALTKMQGKQKGLNGALGSYGKSLGTIGKSLLTLVKIHPVITGVVLAAAAAVWVGVKAWNADKRAAEDAAKAAQDATKAYELVSQTQEEMQTNLDAYIQASQSLNELTRGTYEWVQALNDANQSVLALLKDFPELAQYIENVNGKLEISPEGIKFLQEESQKKVEDAYKAALITSQAQKDAQIKADKTEIKRDIGMTGQSDAKVDAIFEAIDKYGSGFLSDEEEVKKILGVNENIAQGIVDNADSIIELSSEINTNTKTTETFASQMAALDLSKNKQYQNSSESEKALAEKLYGEELNRRTQELYDNEYSKKSKATIRSEYADFLGADTYEKVDKNTAKYLDEDGNEIATIEDATAAFTLAEMDASSGMGDFTNELYNAIDGLIAFRNELLGDNKDTMSEEVSDTFLSKDSKGNFDFSKLSKEQLYDVIARTGGKIDNDFDLSSVDWQEMGYSNLAQFKEDYHKQALDAYNAILEQEQNEKQNKSDLVDSYLGNFNEDKEKESNGIGPELFSNPENFNQELSNPYNPFQSTLATNQNNLTPIDDKYTRSDDYQEYANPAYRSDDYSLIESNKESFIEAFRQAVETEGDILNMPEEELNSFLETHSDSISKYLEAGYSDEQVLESLRNQRLIDDKESRLDEQISTEGLDPEYIEELTEHLQEVEDIDDPLRAEEMAINMAKAEKNGKALNKVFEEYGEILEDADERNIFSEDYAKALKEVKKTMSEITGIGEEFFSNSDLEKAIDAGLFEGNQDAYDDLVGGAMVAQGGDDMLASWGDVLEDLQAQGLMLDVDGDTTSLEQTLDEFTDVTPINQEVHADTSQAVAAVLALYDAGAITADQLANLGYDAVVDVTDVEAEDNQDGLQVDSDYTSTPVTMNARVQGQPFVGEAGSVSFDLVNMDMNVSKKGKETAKKNTQVMSFHDAKAGGHKVVGVKRTTVPAKSGGSGGGSGGGGGGGGKASKIKKSKKSSIVKRYKAVTDDLQDVTRAQEKASKAAERLYGSKRIDAMKEVNKQLKKEIDLLTGKNGKLEEAEGYLVEDRNELDKVFDHMVSKGLDLPAMIFDENKNLENYEEIASAIWAKIHDIQDDYGYDSEVSEEVQKQIDEWTELSKLFEDTLGQYDETLNLIEEINDEAEEKLREIQDNNYEMLTYELEVKIDINDAELKKIEYFFDKTQQDNIYDMVEGMSLLYDKYGALIKRGDEYKQSVLDTYKAFHSDDPLEQISEKDYEDQMRELASNLFETAEEMQEWYRTVSGEYYRDTLDMTIEKLDQYAEGFDHLTDVIDHYKNVASTLGKETDYDLMDQFLTGTVDVIDDKLEASKSKLEMLQRQQVYWENELVVNEENRKKALIGVTNEEERKAINDNFDEQQRMIQENLDATIDSVNDAQDEMLSNVEEKAEAMRAVIENKMAQIAKIMEDTFTNGAGFDTFMSEFEKLNSRQEEYLTKTNQIYETNKLMRQAAQAADKTDNEVAKQKFKNFENETKKLQENAKLSNLELEIQQAKYDLLLAEIALEDAQNAKSTVRLQRDNEGNFGYVYTANQDEIANAQQQYEDAQNALYNISLQGQQDYTAKYLESLQMMQEELTELDQKWLEGEIATQEEYNRQRKAITDHYFNPEYGVLTQYSSLYNIAVQADASATEDYWGKSYGNMTQKTGEWKTAVNTYIGEIDAAFNLWATNQEELNEDLGISFDDVSSAIHDITTESEILKTTIDTTIPKLESITQKVAEETAAWIALNKEVKDNVQMLENMTDYGSGKYNEDGSKKKWNEFGIEDWSREAVRISQGMGETNLSWEDALEYRAEKMRELGYSEEEIALSNGNLANAIKRGHYQTGWDKETQGYLKTIATDESVYFDYDDLMLNHTDLSFDMLMRNTGSSVYTQYAAHESFDSARDAREDKVLAQGKGEWGYLGLEILFERAKHEPRLKAYFNRIAQRFHDTGKYPVINPAEEGIAPDLGTAIREYYATGKDSYGYITNDEEMKEALNSRELLRENERLKNYVLPNKEAFSDLDLSKWGFDTGGYTGSWGPEGKLAMLHQKELVLNASDTENMLKMIEIVRDLSQQIDMFAASQALRGALFSSPSYLTGQNGTLEQNVHIEASFPGVTDRNQIEEAFGNLVNVAYQYANRK